MKKLLIIVVLAVSLVQGLKAVKSSYADSVSNRIDRIESILNEVK